MAPLTQDSTFRNLAFDSKVFGPQVFKYGGHDLPLGKGLQLAESNTSISNQKRLIKAMNFPNQGGGRSFLVTLLFRFWFCSSCP